ncbi:hypothetical protein C8R44DRAFT_894117 [Mycena epipterygia]|nr:hypothetical protein C8R44DRAFT_894117 [Mycena epipterygia]
MGRFSIRTLLFSPAFRVYNLRLLLVASSCTSVYLGMGLTFYSLDPPWNLLWFVGSQTPVAITAIASCSLIFIHHIIIIFSGWRIYLAIIDLTIVLIETCGEPFNYHNALTQTRNSQISAVLGMCYFAYWSASPSGFVGLKNSYVWIFSIHVILLLLSAAFRTTTILACNEKIANQRFAFLGGCSHAHPSYTALTILLNRSLARPLVRGESRLIILIRAVVLSCIGLGIPVFGIYAVIVRPLEATVYTQSVGGLIYDTTDGNATMMLYALTEDADMSRDLVNAQVSARLYSDHQGPNITCSVTLDNTLDGTWVQCPYPWDAFSTVFVSIVFSSTMGVVYVSLTQGDIPMGAEGLYGQFLGWGTPLFRGLHLTGVMTWTERQLILPSRSPVTVFSSDITGLQPQTFSDTDTVDATALSGVATFGGFWSFVNGAFALFFGANIMRPLSALGVVHIFQRRALVRQWNEDFPAIHTEGGTPGSESAGIVAFIRQRLVDLDEDPRSTADDHRNGDVEAQTSVSGLKPDKFENPRAYGVLDSLDESDTARMEISGADEGVEAEHREYTLDEIPLLDMDLGLDKVLTMRADVP